MRPSVSVVVAVLLAASAAGARERGIIEGMVVGNGAPAVGADVAAMAGYRIIAETHTDGSGKFVLRGLPATAFVLSVSARSLTSTTLEHVSVDGGSGLMIRLETAGQKVVGRVVAESTAPIDHAQITLCRSQLQTATPTCFHTTVDVQGAYQIQVAPGAYLIDVDASGFESTAHHLNLSTALTDATRVDFKLRRALPLGPAPPEVMTWLHEQAIPIDTTEAEHGVRDMLPLTRVIGTARVVGLGAATHGSHEFFGLTNRMLQFLVEKMGFSLFAFEAGFTECLAIDDYVLNGNGDPRRALAQMGWVWNTDEMLSLVEWIRRYNVDPSHLKKIEVYGIDISNSAAGWSSAYLRKVDPKPGRNIDIPAEDLLALLDANKAAYVRRSSASEWIFARQNAVVAAQANRWRAQGRNGDLRDRALAENVRWLISSAPPDVRMLVWAHDGHVATSAPDDGIVMGDWLRKWMGADYLAIGVPISNGAFRAIDLATHQMREFALPNLPVGGLGSTLAKTRLASFAIDLRSAPSGPVKEWFSHQLQTWEIGSMFATDMATPTRLAPARSFDVLIFIDRTTASTPLLIPLSPTNEPGKPANLDFEAGLVDGAPQGWHLSGIPAGYRVGVTSERVARGKFAGVIEGPSARPPEGDYGTLMQTAEAFSFRGQRARFRAAVRVDGENEDDHGQLWLRANKADGSFVIDNGSARPIRSREWARYDVIIDVPPGAVSLSYGLILHGKGRAFLDDVSLVPLPPQH